MVLALCVMAAAGGCESPLQTTPSDRGWSSYSDSLIARAVAANSYEIPIQDSTRVAGVHETQSGPNGARVSALVSVNTAPSSDAPQAADKGTPTTTNPESFGQPEPTRPLTLEEAIARTMKHSLAIQVEAYNPAIKETQIAQALGAFDPVFFGQTNWSATNEPVLQALAPSANGQTWANQIGIRQLLPSGGTAQASFGDTYRDYVDGSAFNINPSHQIATGLQLTQPLLKGFGENVSRANIYLAQRDTRIALATFRKQVIDTVSKVEEGYHTLWQAQEALVIQEDLLEKTWESYNNTRERVVMDATAITIKQAQAAYEQRQADLVRTRAAVRNASDNLKALINDPELDGGIKGNVLLKAADKGIEIPVAFSVGEQVDTALRQRTELQEARLQIERADIVINAARNDLLPKADMTVSAQANGLSSGFDDAFSGTVSPSSTNVDWAMGLKFEIPLGGQTTQGALRQHQLERRQAITQMLNIVQQIVLDVRLRMREVLTSYQEMVLRRNAEQSAATALNAITASEVAQPKLSPEFLQLKLDAQQRLANARLDKLQAIFNYNVALMHLEQSKGTLLEYNHIAIGAAPRDDDANKGRFLDHTWNWDKGESEKDAKKPEGK